MSQIPSKVESNLKARWDSTRQAASKEVATAKTAVGELVALKPVQALVDIVVDTLDNVGDWVKEQAAITRRWG